ncbi:Ankyrin repeat domain protein [Wolbachia endosymbiont of Cylisticus convexus]|uniref:ankyrin repeat domain-containing protein n=1 Tax=Wolbachia endosymbiont of Cylisticus convexus TaxID=118728 RepID=UPI000E18D369|nr:ankyrin repeat domain-containing protein [Wolbachia endosymbiont of Cylisticus convexus]RDD34643.1 Ankyrin repeat domain protein [Wolbachia endosymbiont of Cylisticus convexus]
MGWNLFGGLVPPTASAAEEKECRHSGDLGTEEEFEILEREEIKERCHSGDSGNCSEAEEGQNTNRAIELEFQLTQPLLSQVKANENNEDVKSGNTAYQDLYRTDFFVINDQIINNNFIKGLYDKYNQGDDKRLFAKYVFTEMFKHAKVEVPNDHILEELITSCNQAGYDGSLLMQLSPIFLKYRLSLPNANDRKISIVYNSQDSLNVQYCPSMPVRELDTNKEICRIDAILEFTLQFRDSKVEYEDGKVTLTIPKQLENYKANGRSLLDDIKMRFKDADNVIVESFFENIGEGPKSFVVDLPAEVDSDSFNIIPENAVFDLSHIAESVKKAVDDKDVNVLATYIRIVQARVNRVSPQEGLSVVEKTLEIVSGFIKEQGKAWSCYPTVPMVDLVYSAKQCYDGYISQADYGKVENLKKNLYKIKSDLIKRSSNSGSPVINAQDTSAMLNETPTSSQAVSREDNNQLNIKRDPEFKSTDNQQVIDELHKTINKYNTEGFTSLHVAAQKGDVELGRHLLQCGANIEITSKAKVDGCTALHLAARNGHKDFAKLLLDKGANVDSLSSTGSRVTPLHEAAYDGHLDVAELLIERGATVDAKDRHNCTPLMYASAEGHSAIVELLLQKKADPYLQDNNGETALHLAAYNGHPDVVAILIGAAEDKEKYVNMQSNSIGTALHVIAYNREINEGHKKSAKLLTCNGTSPYLENDPIINTPQDPLQKVSSLEMAKTKNKEFWGLCHL